MKSQDRKSNKRRAGRWTFAIPLIRKPRMSGAPKFFSEILPGVSLAPFANSHGGRGSVLRRGVFATALVVRLIALEDDPQSVEGQQVVDLADVLCAAAHQ